MSSNQKNMNIPTNSWQAFFETEKHKLYYQNLIKDVAQAYQKTTCFPPKELIFNAFEQCDLENIKVVIIGQDPYHGEKEANGLCFSVNDGIKLPPSLVNIFKELSQNYKQQQTETTWQPISGDLSSWAKQGVLLLNATLTVEKDKANSHKNIGWQTFTDNVIDYINAQKADVVFLLWGGFAHKKGKNIDTNKHLVLQSGHPSPLSANQGKWFGNEHFLKTNNFLISKEKTPINWYEIMSY